MKDKDKAILGLAVAAGIGTAAAVLLRKAGAEIPRPEPEPEPIPEPEPEPLPETKVLTSITINLDKATYNPGESPRVQAIANDQFAAPFGTVTLFIRVRNPAGSIIESGSMSAVDGILDFVFDLSPTAIAGTYTVDVSNKFNFT